MPKLNQRGLDLIKENEGLRLVAYPDRATGAKPYTIGYGFAGPGVTLGLRWTKERAEWMLNIVTNQVSKELLTILDNLKIDQINDNQFSAMVSFAYNIKNRDEVMTHILQEVGLSGFPNKIKEYIYADHKIMNGLKTRREKEAALFNLKDENHEISTECN